MPAVSKAQRKLFGLALAVKRGEVDASTVDQKIRDLSKKKEADLKDYAETPEETLPNKLEDSVDENAELQVGTSVEMEHTDDPNKAETIAKDHLAEDPNYYSKLYKAGLIDEPAAIQLAKSAFESVNEAMDGPINFAKGDKLDLLGYDWEIIKTDYAPKKSFKNAFTFTGNDLKQLRIPNPPKTNKTRVGYLLKDTKSGDTAFLYQYISNASKKLYTKLVVTDLKESVAESYLQESIAYAEAMRYALEENNAMATPGSVNGMGSVSLPGNPGTQAEFSTQETGSGDLAASSELTDDEKENEKQAKNIYNFLKFNAFVGESVNEDSKDTMIKQIERALKDDISIFKLPMATQKYYAKNKSDFESVNEGFEWWQPLLALAGSITIVAGAFFAVMGPDMIINPHAIAPGNSWGDVLRYYKKKFKDKQTAKKLKKEDVLEFINLIQTNIDSSDLGPGAKKYMKGLMNNLQKELNKGEGDVDKNKLLSLLRDVETYAKRKGIKVDESVNEGINEAKDNLYLQLHKKYAEQIQGLKAKKIKKLTDLVSVQRWAMEDREDYFDLTKSEIKEISSVFNDERKLFKKYMDGDHSVLLPESVNESSGRDPKSIQKEYKELKKASIDYLRREWSRHFRIGDPKGTDRAGLISDLLRAYHGDKYVDAAFEALETTDTHEQLAEIKKHEQAIYDSGESGAISLWESFAKRVIGKDGMWKDAPFQSYTDAVRELKSIMTKYSIKA